MSIRVSTTLVLFFIVLTGLIPSGHAQDQYQYVTQWGSNGSAPGQFNHPAGIAIDASGNVFVTDPNRVQKFDPNGQFILEWGGYGSEPGKFHNPHGISVDSSGDIYVMDTANARIQKFSPDGALTGILKLDVCNCTMYQECIKQGPYAQDCYAIAIDSKNDIYVVNTPHNHVYKFTPDGKESPSWGPPGSNGQYQAPVSIAIGPDDTVYVGDGQFRTIQSYDSNGRFLNVFGSFGQADGQFYLLQGITVDKSGNIYVVDSVSNNRIQKFDSNGRFITKLQNKFDMPADVAVDNSGNVYVVEFHGKKVQKFMPVNNQSQPAVEKTQPATPVTTAAPVITAPLPQNTQGTVTATTNLPVSTQQPATTTAPESRLGKTIAPQTSPALPASQDPVSGFICFIKQIFGGTC